MHNTRSAKKTDRRLDGSMQRLPWNSFTQVAGATERLMICIAGAALWGLGIGELAGHKESALAAAVGGVIGFLFWLTDEFGHGRKWSSRT